MRMATVQAPPTTTEQRFRVDAVDWPSYLKIGEGFGERRIRVTYDRGRLELMTVSPQHDGWKSFLGRMLAALCDELGIDFAGFGGMTRQREESGDSQTVRAFRAWVRATLVPPAAGGPPNP